MFHLKWIAPAALLSAAFCQLNPCYGAQSARDMFMAQLKDASHQINSGVTYCVELSRGGKTQLVDRDFTFAKGDGVRIHIKANFDGYAHVTLATSTGSRTALFPQGNQPNTIEHGKEYIFPSSGMFTFNEAAGVEAVHFLVSRQPVEVDSPALMYAAKGKSVHEWPHPATKNQGFVINLVPEEPVTTVVYLDHSHMQAQPVPLPAMSPAAAVSPPSVNRPFTDKWAVLAGIGTFARYHDGSGQDRRGTLTQTVDFRNYLVHEAGFDPTHVCVAEDNLMTRHNVEDVLIGDWLANLARPDDLVLIYLSSHGTDRGGDGKNYIATFTGGTPGSTADVWICMQDLGKLIKDKVRSQRVVIVLESCYSGAATKDLDRSSALDEMLQGAGQIIICSAQPEKESTSNMLIYGNFFTHFFLKELRHHRALKDAFDAAAKESGDQSPIISYARWQGNDLVLSAHPTNPRGPVPNPFLK